ncbi:hypothetical protein SAMN04488540_11078 [Ferrimonas sediminum]|uniref:Uncharacterized protein n=1 Tax=Ferrimonas sediminum TaxID=718193 RepID=A0A1G8V2D5_9GAMM|nr:hypothetical protein [Ferrimonas sediminum]SDJ60252.1 hypothetical protein SAMN04488540_11078 [Ferrimonas sediminum]
MRPLFLLLMAPLLLTGCASRGLLESYPHQLDEVKTQLSRDNGQPLVPLQSGLDSQDGLLYAQEAGRVALLQGDFTQSRGYFEQAMAQYDRRDWKAMVSLTDLSAQAAGSTVSEQLIPYRGQAYERIMVHQYQALNYLFSGDLGGATVEARRADQAQTLALQAYRNRDEVQTLNNASINAELSRLDSQGGTALNSFLNSYTLYQNAVLFEAQGEANDALIDIRKALQAYPDNQLLGGEYVRLSCQLQIDCDGARKRFGKAPATKAGQGRVVVLVETGFVAAKQAITIPFTIDGYYQQVSMPTYRSQRPATQPVTIRLSGDHKYQGQAEVIGNMDHLAVRALQEQYPGILVRQALRVAAKAGTNQWAEKKGGDVGAIAMQLFNALTEQADRRSWLTLPHQAWMWPHQVTPGQYQLTINGSPQPIEVQAGKTTLIWAVQTGPRYRIHSVIL